MSDHDDNPDPEAERTEAQLRDLLQPAASKDKVWTRLESSIEKKSPQKKSSRSIGVLDWVAIAASVALCTHLVIKNLPAKPAAPVVTFADEQLKKAPPLTAEEKAKIDKLIADLSSEEFDRREKAEIALQALGEKALAALEALKPGDADLQQRVAKLTGEIRGALAHKAAVEKLNAQFPGAAEKLGLEDPAQRQAAVLAWVKTADKMKAAPFFVTLCGELQAGPLLWACWDVLNFYSVEEAFVSGAGARSWATAGVPTDTVTTKLTEFWPGIRFGPVAKKVCDVNIAPDQNQGISGRLILATQLNPLGLGYCLTLTPGTVHVLSRTEGAQYWREWWDAAKQTPEWQGVDLATAVPANVKAWLEALRGTDARSVLQNTRRIIDTWDEAGVQAAVKNLAESDGMGADRAHNILALTRLRQAGTIYFNVQDAENHMTIYAMNPDGSKQRRLFPADPPRNWWLHGHPVNDLLFMTDWGKDDVYWWKAGMAAPEPFPEGGAPFAGDPSDHKRILFFSGKEEDGNRKLRAWNTIDGSCSDVMDVKGQPLFQPKVNYPQLAANKSVCVYSCLEQTDPDNGNNNRYSVWVADLAKRTSRQILTEQDGMGLHYTSVNISADGRWVCCPGIVFNGKEKTLFSYVIDVETGKRADLAEKHGWVTGQHWDANKTRLYFYATSAPVAQRPDRELSLGIWEPSNSRTIVLPAEIQKSAKNYGGGLKQWLDGRLLVSHAQTFLVDPDGKTPPERTTLGDMWGERKSITVGGETWLLAEQDGIPGTLGRQIVLTSPDGRTILPITNLVTGGSSPEFVPRAP